MDPRFNRAHGAMAGLIFGRSLGVDTSTKGRQAFADAVWNDHLLVEQTRQEFQASALVAAAISLGIDKKHYWVRGIGSVLGEAIDYVVALPTRGSASSEPDVLQAARKAIGTVRTSVMTSTSACAGRSAHLRIRRSRFLLPSHLFSRTNHGPLLSAPPSSAGKQV